MVAYSQIDDYLAGVPDKYKELLTHVRLVIKSVVPDAEEVISYQLPAFKQKGKVVAGFAAYKNHCSFFPFSGSVLSCFTEELATYSQTKGALHFSPQKPLADDLIRRMVEEKLRLDMKRVTKIKK